jgi:hypothetical protein
MIINLTGLKMVVTSTHETCAFHKKNPGVNYAGCTCGGSYSGRYVRDPNPPKKCVHCDGTGIEKASG